MYILNYFFLIEIFFCLLPQVFKHSMSYVDSKVTLILQEKIAKFELSCQEKVLDEYSSTLKFFLVKHVHISIFIN